MGEAGAPWQLARKINVKMEARSRRTDPRREAKTVLKIFMTGNPKEKGGRRSERRNFPGKTDESVCEARRSKVT